MRILIVHTDAAFDGDRNRHGLAHGSDAFADQRGLAHQRGAEASRLHAVRRTADVQIDLVIAKIRTDARTLRQFRRLRAAELQRDGMLDCGKADQPLAVAVQDRIGRHHLRIETRAAGKQAVQDPAMPIRPIHHRRDGEEFLRYCQCLAIMHTWSPQPSSGDASRAYSRLPRGRDAGFLS